PLSVGTDATRGEYTTAPRTRADPSPRRREGALACRRADEEAERHPRRPLTDVRGSERFPAEPRTSVSGPAPTHRRHPLVTPSRPCCRGGWLLGRDSGRGRRRSLPF